jgi:hypothetical protein
LQQSRKQPDYQRAVLRGPTTVPPVQDAAIPAVTAMIVPSIRW